MTRSNPILADATDLSFWAERRDAQEQLPRLIRKLIFASVEKIERIGFPADEAVQIGGWDGIVQVSSGNAYVPDGQSAWELGTTKDIKGKADGDYEKRTLDPRGLDLTQTTFIFVTPRRWGNKDKWVTDRLAEGKWRDVRAYDADDLHTWLELAPTVHIWLSSLVGKRPDGLTDLDTAWLEWSEATVPAIPPQLVTSGREQESKRILEWLLGPPSILAVLADTRDEALAFYLATLLRLPAEECAKHIANGVVVENESAWRWLRSASTTPLLIALFEERKNMMGAVRDGCHVLVPLDRRDAPNINMIELPRLRLDALRKAMGDMGFAHNKIDDLAVLARRSLTAFRRRIAGSGSFQCPAWAKPEAAHQIVPALLADAWEVNREADQVVLTELTQASYRDVYRTLVRWANEPDPPVRFVGSTCEIAAKEDAWGLLARYLTGDDLRAFEKVAINVLGTIDPRYDLPPHERFMGGAVGKILPESQRLRHGLVDTLALMGTRDNSSCFTDGTTGPIWATQIVRQVLGKAIGEWRLWASLESMLPLLAEAAPAVFLEVVETELIQPTSAFGALFPKPDEENIGFWGTSPYVGLLWALETLAWSPEHLSRAALALAQLAGIDPNRDSNHVTRPHNSLRDIFLSWKPCTSASLSQRCVVLDHIRRKTPEIAWKLLCSILPRPNTFTTATARPHWREWDTDGQPSVTYAELWRTVDEITDRLLTDVGHDGNKWQDLIDIFASIPLKNQTMLIERLRLMDVATCSSEDIRLIADSLRAVIAQHREFSTADWALPSTTIDDLEEVSTRFVAPDVISRNIWVFSARPSLPGHPRKDWQNWEDAVASARKEAAQAIYIGGMSSLLGAVAVVEQPGELGLAVGRCDFLTESEETALLEELASTDQSRHIFACGFVFGRFTTDGWAWANVKLADTNDWQNEQKAEFYSVLPCEANTWDRIDAESETVQRLYWMRVSVRSQLNLSDLKRVVGRYLYYGRGLAAIEILSHNTHDTKKLVDPALIVAALDQALLMPHNERIDTTMLAYHVAELLAVLESSDAVDEGTLARLEWAYLPLLRHYRGPHTLHRELARNPDFFVQLLILLYRGEHEENRNPTNEEANRARVSYELLESWHTLPGTQENGSIAIEQLREWVLKVRENAQKADRIRSADRHIGHLLAFCASDPDATWPATPIRDLLEELANTNIEQALEIQVRNNRGMVTKTLFEGGKQEHILEEHYRRHAQAVCDQWPRTAAVLRSIAETYAWEARQADAEAELEEDHG